MKRKFIEKIPIEKGWSGDQKYRVRTENGTDYFLRVSPIDRYERKKAEFEYMQAVATLGVPMGVAVDFGRTEETVWLLEEFVYGDMAEDVIPHFDKARQYAYGCRCGEILRRIHEIPAADAVEDWAPYFNRKMNRKIKLYKDSPIKYPDGENFIAYIEENRHLLAGRPQCRQHGDYHIGNMMVRQDGMLCIIDFDRFDTGDPWEEFNRIVWCAQKAPAFATGMVDGYFEGKIPMEFWRLLALYISSNTLASIPWALPFGQGEIDVMLTQAEEILGWYDGMRCVIPSWYKK